MSDDPNEKEQPEDEEEVEASAEDDSSEASDETNSSSGDDESSEKTQSSEAEEIDLEPVDSDEGPSGGPSIALGQGELAEKDEKLFASLAHFSGIVSVIGPLVFWILKKNDSPFVDDQGKEALNFQITLFIALSACTLLSCFGFGIPLVGILLVVNVIFCIIAGVAANDGKVYRYPFALRLIK